MTEPTITLTAFACAAVFLTALDHWLYLERQWLRIQIRRQTQLVSARTALSQGRTSRPIGAISIPVPAPKETTIERLGETWEDWIRLAECSANDHGAERLEFPRRERVNANHHDDALGEKSAHGNT